MWVLTTDGAVNLSNVLFATVTSFSGTYRIQVSNAIGGNFLTLADTYPTSADAYAALARIVDAFDPNSIP